MTDLRMIQSEFPELMSDLVWFLPMLKQGGTES